MRDVTEMLTRSGVTAKRFEFFASEEEFSRVAAATPHSHCVLDSGKAIDAGLRLTPVREALQRAMTRMAGER